MSQPFPILDRHHIKELHDLLGTVEDWLLHCSDDAFDDLAAFLTSLSPSPPARPGEHLAADLVNHLGDHTVRLTAALRHANPPAAPPATGAPR